MDVFNRNVEIMSVRFEPTTTFPEQNVIPNALFFDKRIIKNKIYIMMQIINVSSLFQLPSCRDIKEIYIAMQRLRANLK